MNGNAMGEESNTSDTSASALSRGSYRMLAAGEIIKEGDYFVDDDGVLRPTMRAGEPAPDPKYTAHRQYRRYCRMEETTQPKI